MRVERARQGVLTVGKWAWAAYFSEVRALFSLRPSERCLAASASSRFSARLQMRVKSKRRGVLTVGFRVAGSVLEDFEARVCLERLAERPCTHWTDPIVLETANGGQISVSGGANSVRCDGLAALLERSDCCAGRDVLGQHLCNLGVDALARQIP